MYRNVLVPTDGSEAAERAVEQAFEIADRFDATVHVLFVVDVDENYPLDVSTDPITEGLRAEGERLTAEIVDRAPEGINAVAAVEDGSPHERILEYAEEHDVGLIVMGTHGRRGLEKFLLGSVTERVTRTADCSVLVTRVPADGSVVSTAEEAADLAREALAAEGYEEVAVPETPHEKRGHWLVRTESDGERVDVRVDRPTGDARIGDGE